LGVRFWSHKGPGDYVQRSGRTGRAGSSGSAMYLVDRSEIKLLSAIEKLIKRPIERTTITGWTPDMVKAEPAHARDRDDDERPQRRNNAPRRSGSGRPAPKAGGHPGESRRSSSSGRKPATGNAAAGQPRQHGNPGRGNGSQRVALLGK